MPAVSEYNWIDTACFGHQEILSEAARFAPHSPLGYHNVVGGPADELAWLNPSEPGKMPHHEFLPASRRPSSPLRSAIVWYLGWLCCATAVYGQVNPQAPTREYPPNEYYLCFRLIDQGDFVKAAQAFRSAARGGIRTSEGTWVDSVCYHSMIGECYYQMGDLGQALEQFTIAQRLLVSHGNWMLRIEFPATIEPRNTAARTPVTWGASTRRTVAGRFPNRYPILQGRFDNLNTLQRGGVISFPEFYLINAHEVVRCGALAIRRRGEILGRTSQHDALNADLITLLTARPAPPNHWSQSWVDSLLGMAYSATGRIPDAISALTKSLQVGGQYDHPVTPMALQQLGRLAFQQARYDAAAQMFLEASISAAWFEQTDLMEEAFRWGTTTHLVTGPQGINPILEPAIAWARRERSELLEASLLIQEANNAAELSQTVAAGSLLEQARRPMVRREMVKGAVGARLNYVAALTAFQAGNLSAGENAWNAVVAYQTNPQRLASHRLFEINLVDALALSGNVTPRIANELYTEVLREPTVSDWTTNLVESLTVTIAPNLVAYEHWLAVARERGEHEKMAEIADQIRRLRFFSTLTMGGRLLALNWVLEAPKESLSEKMVLVRQDLLTRYPKYAEASRLAGQTRDQLTTGPIVAEDAAGTKQQQQLFTELAAVSQTQELMLRELALRREATEVACPPALDFKQFQSKLSDKQAVLAFLITSKNDLYGFLIRRGEYATWQIPGANKLGKILTELLKQMGQFERNATVELQLLKGETWKPIAVDLWGKLTEGLKPEVLVGVDELIIVPDRWLWYAPFEAFPGATVESPPIIARMATRYVPTVSLALPDKRPANVGKDSILLLGKALTPAETAGTTDMAAQLRKVLGKVTEFQGSLPAPSSLFGTICRRVIVFDDVDPLGRGAWDWFPFSLDREKNGSTIGAWLALPWGAPDHLILPAYHTAAEAALKRAPTGDELFLAACGLMASGSRTILLSRWRTGGQTSCDLVREFVQESPFMTASAAWQRSVQLAMEKDLDITREPRIKAGESDAGVRAAHPFLWAGYVLIDSGASPPRDK